MVSLHFIGALLLVPVFLLVLSKTFGPLGNIPGPFAAKWTRFWLTYWARKGKRYEAVHKAHEKYGTFVTIAPGHISVADPDAVPLTYGHGTGTLKPDFYDAFASATLKKRGLFNTRDRTEHARKRKIVSHVFAQRSVVEFEPYIRNLLDKFIKKWDGLCESAGASEGAAEEKGKGWAWFDCLPWYNFLAFDIIGDLAFGSPFGMIEKEKDEAAVEQPDGTVELLPAVEILNLRGLFSATQGALYPWMRPFTIELDPWFKEGLKSVKNLAGIARARVNVRLQEGAGDRKDLLARLQEGVDDEGKPMGKDELTMEALTQLIAGSDTTSNSLCAITYHIVSNPRAHQKLVAELDEAFQANPLQGASTYDEVKNLPYLAACIDESLRRHSTSSIGLPRLLIEDANFKGHHFPKGTVLSVPAYTLHHLPSIYPDPYTFRPERFLPPEVNSRPDNSYLPFSFGPRACVGRNLAMMELLIVVSTLFYRYEFRLEDPSKELESAEGFLRKPLACVIGIRRRKHD